ncbi:MAG TPA: aminotransferase class I/II-fold pyridoxal phosphate-dependent enzyme [Chitinophagaceae bacterium]|nr:aminotransferase class I/II-fold pyridoxal phosphate-dependent enzyme [Chitinophagaceae bacterium]
MKLSRLAETLIGSEIIRLGGVINDRIRAGEKIYNFTIGDFDPRIFPIPPEFEGEIIAAYRDKQTYYPPAEGLMSLRQSVSDFLRERENLRYDPAGEILISCGGRPLIYAIYRTLVDSGDRVIYAVPSWNNNHYTHFVDGEHAVVETKPENNFMPTAEEIRPLLKGATLLALCSPLNPAGTAFSKVQLEAICDLVIEENNSRGQDSKKLFILYDQIYWVLCYGNTVHYNPVTLRPALRDYTLFVDGMSKTFAATGVRVGWSMGPAPVIAKMKGILSHIGAWGPMAEQTATAAYLRQQTNIDRYLLHFKSAIQFRLNEIYEGFMDLKRKGYPVDCVVPQAAIYLAVKIDLAGRKTPGGSILENQPAVTAYILQEASLALVPFYAFGASAQSPWYRLSVGTCHIQEIGEMFSRLEKAICITR